MSNLFVFIFPLALIGMLVSLVIAIIKKVQKKPAKSMMILSGILLLVGFFSMVMFGVTEVAIAEEAAAIEAAADAKEGLGRPVTEDEALAMAYDLLASIGNSVTDVENMGLVSFGTKDYYLFALNSSYDIDGERFYDSIVVQASNGKLGGSTWDEGIVSAPRWAEIQDNKPIPDAETLALAQLPELPEGLEWVEAPYLSNELWPNSINGTIRNVSGKELSSITISFLVNGENGNQLKDVEDSFNGLRDGNTWEFEAYNWDGDGVVGSWEFKEVYVIE